MARSARAGRWAGALAARWVAAGALAASLALAACGGEQATRPAAKPPDFKAALRGSPPELAAIHRQAGQLLDGGEAAFRARLRELRGHPVVVNKWASWCGPCRRELPFFQSRSAKLGKRIAFLGVNSNDSLSGARRFIKEFPVPYPSYKDPKLELAAVFKAVIEFPATAFYDARGGLRYVKRGGYATEAELAGDIRRYAR